MDRVKDKVVIITGAAGGLGGAQAALLSREGAKVVVTDVLEEEVKKVAESIRAEGLEAIHMKQDVTRERDWEEVIEKTRSEHGRLDVLVNNAGVMIRKSVEDTSLEEWRWVMSVNMEGVFLGTKHAIGAMKKTGGGSIINISSAAGIAATPNSSAYIASKGAVRLFSKAVAIECSKAVYDYNIRVNSVHPGFTWTAMAEKIIQSEVEMTGKPYEEVKRNKAAALMPIGRFGEPDDIAYAVLYLASDESKFMTGSEFVIDGGWTAR